MNHESVIASDRSTQQSSTKLPSDTASSLPTQSRSELQVGLSACLAGQPVRYNGGHSQSRLCLNLLSQHFHFRTFCPEVAAGFGTPRPTLRLIGDPENPQLAYSSAKKSASPLDNNSPSQSHPDEDLTRQLTEGFKEKLEEFHDLDGYILMKNSPSCGLERVKVYQSNGYPHRERAQGLFAHALQQRYPLMPIEEEGRLHDAKLFENFVLRLYAYHNFRKEVLSNPSMGNLIAFHSSYKYILMAHHQPSYKSLGRLLGYQQTPKTESETRAVIDEYFPMFMQALSKPANKKNHTNTLYHILGYLKKTVPSTARQNIVDIITHYQQGVVPLITPLTLLKHYIDQYGSDYIRKQRYLQPYPYSLGCANRL
ncbi:DUF1722 domain-containing protein [Aestuariicella hydrocarbonica]|uniref:DUF1722 domain-containing protein n=1 Tax=Pseudomaricurvus hydrocarbonicus TaxID=1470433 RepID=A0A9E5MNK1_9GAMM|nr:DUF523 and DUF1722 domain-containing protein [Aestuariicella hydrocarbonica]NHO67493.1 DUF1722 domain-containing protein [Aestuariicella hydrocarbonica]